jgi:hypothetical protein
MTVSPTIAQSSTSPAAPTQRQDKPTVTVERLPMLVLRIGIDRVEAQNRTIFPVQCLGPAHEFEHDDDLRVAVLHGNGPDF